MADKTHGTPEKRDGKPVPYGNIDGKSCRGGVCPPVYDARKITPKDVISHYESSQQNTGHHPHMRIVCGIGKPIAHGVWVHHIAHHRAANQRIVHGVVYHYRRGMGVVDGQQIWIML